MVKLILPIELTAEIEPHLPSDTKFVRVDSDGNFDGDASDAEIYLNGFKLKPTTLHKVLTAAPGIRWQQTPSAGVNHILTPIFLEHDITLTNGAGVHAIPISEFVLSLILYHAKQLRQLQADHDQRKWEKSWLVLPELANSTVLILGTGNIGQAIAARIKPFGARVWGGRRRPEPLPNFDKIVGTNEWHALLPEVDYIIVATPLTPETKALIDEAVLRSLPSHAYLINVGRGAVVDESALTKALTEGWIAGAGLDTVSIEPLPPESPLWSLPNLFITPHTSAISPALKGRITNLFLDNLERYRGNKPLRNVVNKEAGY
ncbi:D-2-hydroxyacid dehydrogenase [Nostoc sp. UCD121]|uniref:D-2-hydroxyacid dehydrogenase n=1 Tax=unclassified Nostoc TaxID=2593658 RepID=UPI0016260D02|nr:MULTISPECIES: D-2-hydroxyacid dehydrogenase [unclassified Nostoc]MBC1222892.1 D-2-hydroxyacid dehydrogenase [Nostoc sp. UCD120]MBC1279463.1 D-2-hydroxyacid dehydrogenase [Nostoc sp. UCD121]MBC1297212.1 D-2-hydroxyacid dehydrogenase [Nostoc sp. UCD122]